MKERGDKPNTRERLSALAPGFGNRVEAAVTALGGAAAASKVLPIHENQIRRIINEETVPSFPAMAVLAKKTGYRPEWLAFAELPDKSMANDLLLQGKIIVKTDDSGGFQEMVRVNDARDSSTHLFSTKLIAGVLKKSAEDLVVLPMPGEAMEPLIGRDDVLLIDTSDTRAGDGEIYAFDFGGDLVVRRTQREPDGALALRAENPKFERMSLQPALMATAKVLGKIVWIGGPV